ncbi:hypothetical protein JBE04_11215 [Streptomyces sp. PRKS01-29]|nr:hypothetical protein [Streptomyces sabulosicollis]MBI0295026.1 hypothetical protein [Streptomyces sabulosicollis]
MTTVIETAATSDDNEATADELTAEERAWIAKWLERSPEWSAEKWNRMGQLLGVRFN